MKKIFIAIDLPCSYIEDSYSLNKKLIFSSSEEQKIHFRNDFYGWCGAWIKPFYELGYIVYESHYTNSNIQKKICSENFLNYLSNYDTFIYELKINSPEILIIETVRDFPVDFLARLRKDVPSIKILIGHVCNPWYDPSALLAYDFIFTCLYSINDQLKEKGVNAHYLANAFNSEILKSKSYIISPKVNRVMFYGQFILNNINIDLYSKNKNFKILSYVYNIYSFVKSRKFSRISRAVRIHQRNSLYGIELFNTISSYMMALNIHADIAKNEAANMRMFEVTGVGTCLITDYKDNLTDFFSSDEILTYKDKLDCLKTIVWALNNPNLVNKIAFAGQQKTLKHHTYFNRAEQIHYLINEY